jgi:hypothetical protein
MSKTFPRLFNLFGTSDNREGKRAARRLAVQLTECIGKKVHISWYDAAGQQVVDGTLKKKAGWAFVVACENKLEANEIRTKFWAGATAFEAEPFRFVKLPTHAKNFVFDAQAGDHSKFVRENLDLTPVEEKVSEKIKEELSKPKKSKAKSKKTKAVKRAA